MPPYGWATYTTGRFSAGKTSTFMRVRASPPAPARAAIATITVTGRRRAKAMGFIDWTWGGGGEPWNGPIVIDSVWRSNGDRGGNYGSSTLDRGAGESPRPRRAEFLPQDVAPSARAAPKRGRVL